MGLLFFAITFFLVYCLHFIVLCSFDDNKEQTKGNMDYHLVKLSRARNNYDKAVLNEVKEFYKGKIDKNIESIHDIRDERKTPGTKTLAHIDEKDKGFREKCKRKSKKRKTPSSPTVSL